MRLKSLQKSEFISAKQRNPFIYFERCKLSIDGQCGVAHSSDFGELKIPLGATAGILLGPGTSVTHEFTKLSAKSSCCVVFVGGQGLPSYTHLGCHQSPQNQLKQYSFFVDERKRLLKAKELLLMRKDWIPDGFDNLSDKQIAAALTVEDLRLIEARWYKRYYHQLMVQYDINMDPLRKNSRLCSSFLYGAIIPNLLMFSLSPNLGVLHGIGGGGGLIWDIADIFKPTFVNLLAAEASAGRWSDSTIKKKMVENLNSYEFHVLCAKVLEDFYR